MDKSELFPSTFMRAEELEGDLTLTIKSLETLKTKGLDGVERPQRVLSFHEHTKKLGLNKTNWTTISRVLNAPDDDDWVGKQITLYATEVHFQGQTTLGIRVRIKVPKAPQKKQAAPATSTDEDVPF